jgi:hypothetical protein
VSSCLSSLFSKITGSYAENDVFRGLRKSSHTMRSGTCVLYILFLLFLLRVSFYKRRKKGIKEAIPNDIRCLSDDVLVTFCNYLIWNIMPKPVELLRIPENTEMTLNDKTPLKNDKTALKNDVLISVRYLSAIYSCKYFLQLC